MAPDPAPAVRTSARLRAALASVEAAAVAGIVCAAGWSIGLRGLLATPAIDADAEEIRSFYADPANLPNALLLLQVVALATLAFLWFIGVVRGRRGAAAPRLFGTVFLGGGILVAGLVLAGTAALAAPSVLVSLGGPTPDPADVGMTRALAVSLLSVFAPRAATLVILSTAALGRVTGALPRWLVWLSYAVGIAEFVNVTVSTPTVYVFPAWIALVSVVLLVRRPTLSRVETAGSDTRR